MTTQTGPGSKSCRRVLTLLAAAIATANTLLAAPPDLPAPDALLQRHLDGLGGAAALRQAPALTFKGAIDLPFMKAKAPIEFLFQAPDRFYCELRYHHAFFGFLKVPFFARRHAECGFDGKSGWLVDFDENVEALYGIDEAFFRGLLDKFSPLCFSRNFPLTRTLDIQPFAGRDCYRVLVVLPCGAHAFEFYDVKSGLLAGTVYPFETDNSVIDIRTTYSDFRRVGACLRLPFRLEFEVAGDHYSIQASEIRTDLAGTRLPPSKFKGTPPSVPRLTPAAVPAQEVLDKYVAACGGAEALRRHRSLKLVGTYRFSGSVARVFGSTNSVEVLLAPTNRFAFSMPTRMGPYSEGSDGEHYWTAQGTNITFAAGKALAQQLAQKSFLAELHPPEAYRSLDTVGTLNIGGHNCYELLLVRQDGEVLEEFYDTESGLLRMRRITDQRHGGALRLSTTYDDYRRFGDWSLPARQSFQRTGAPQVMTIEKVEWDTAPDAAFEMPPEVKARL